MMKMRAKDLLSKLMFKKPPATEEAIQRLVSALGYPLPEEYLEFLRFSDGAEGFVSPNEYVMLDSSEEVIQSNVEDDNWKSDFAPWLILFGSNGGGTAYAFDARLPGMPVVDTPFIGGGLDYLTQRGRSFSEFIENLADA